MSSAELALPQDTEVTLVNDHGVIVVIVFVQVLGNLRSDFLATNYFDTNIAATCPAGIAK